MTFNPAMPRGPAAQMPRTPGMARPSAMVAGPRMPHGISHFDTGGVVDDSGSGGDITTGIAPTATNQAPMAQNAIQRYQSMSPEELQELAVRLGGTPQGQMVQQILTQKRIRPQMADGGGMMSPQEGMPWWSRQEERSSGSGLLHSAVAGRTDQLKVSPLSGSFVVPADVVSGLGEGNSLAGARILQEEFQTGPYGVPLPKIAGRTSAPRAPAPPPQEHAKGGATQQGPVRVPILGAGGEFILGPHHLIRKFGSVERAHKILDKWVVHERKKIIKTMSKLPGPAQD